jgi:hypothetical protein
VVLDRECRYYTHPSYKDTWNIYFDDQKVSEATMAFEDLRYGYGKDQRSTYYRGEKIK